MTQVKIRIGQTNASQLRVKNLHTVGYLSEGIVYYAVNDKVMSRLVSEVCIVSDKNVYPDRETIITALYLGIDPPKMNTGHDTAFYERMAQIALKQRTA